jgi:hypothetical protein
MREPARRGAGLIAALALTAWMGADASAAPRATAAAQTSAPASEVARVLRAPAEDRQALAAALVELGTPAIEALIDARRDKSVRASDGLSRFALTPPRLLAVGDALSKLPRPQLVASLSERIERAATGGDRRVVIELVGEIGEVDDLELLVEAATPPKGEAGLDSSVTVAAQDALGLLFARHPAALEPAAHRMASAHVDVAPAIARAVAASASPASFDLLVRALERAANLDLVILPLLAKAEGRYTSPKRERLLELVREHLASTDPMLARSAAHLCGELGDSLAVPALCELLEGADVQRSAAAHGSLRKLTGLGFPAERARWKLWLESEEAWRQAEAEAVLEDLSSEREDAIVRALQTVAQHPLHRDLFAPSVVAVARRSESSLRLVACSVLGRLRAPSSVAALRELALDRDLTAAANEALRAIDPSLVVPVFTSRAARAQRR